MDCRVLLVKFQFVGRTPPGLFKLILYRISGSSNLPSSPPKKLFSRNANWSSAASNIIYNLKCMSCCPLMDRDAVDLQK